MSVNNKRFLSMIVYYTLIVLALASAGFFIYTLITRDVAGWAKVVYFIWVALVIAVLIYDIMCTNKRQGKERSGFVIYVLSVLAVIMACILYFMNTGRAGLTTDFLSLFASVAIISLMTTGYMIASWCVGENLVEHRTAEDKIRDRQ